MSSCPCRAHPIEARCWQEAARKSQRVDQEGVAHPVDALEQGKRHAVNLGHGQEAVRLGLLDKGLRRIEVGGRRHGRDEPLQRAGDAVHKAGQ